MTKQWLKVLDYDLFVDFTQQVEHEMTIGSKQAIKCKQIRRHA